MIDVMSFGGGVQSTAIMVLAGEGYIPMPKHWVFSDPGFEGADTYAHLERCKDYISKNGGQLDIVTTGNIEEDALTFARRRANSDVKRYASIPMYVEKHGGGAGILPRQCTSEYKIEPIEQYHRRVVMGLEPRQRAPKELKVAVWIGISADEERRASPPGRWKELEVETGKDLMGEPITATVKKWNPVPWQVKTYPLLGYTLYPDRSRETDDRFEFCSGWDREDSMNFLAKAWPWPVPRSACICCPYRTNDEWRSMRDNSPEDWARAVVFDKEIREAYADGQRARRALAGVPFLHRTRKPLDVVDLSEPLNDRMGCGGLFSQEPDGICGV
jgi:hypothetical protein